MNSVTLGADHSHADNLDAEPQADRATFGSVALYFLGLAYAAEQVGLLAHPANAAFAIALLAAGVITRVRRVPLTPAVGWGATGIIAGLGLLPIPITLRFFAVAIAFFGVSRLRKARGDDAGVERILGLSCALFGIYQFLASSSPLVWHLRQDLSIAISGWASIDGSFVAGPTYLGTDALALVLLAAVSRGIVSGRMADSAVAIGATGAIAWLNASFVGSLPLLAQSDNPQLAALGSTLFETIHPLNYGWTLIPLMAIPAVWLLRLPHPALRPELRSRRSISVALVLVASLGPLLLFNPPPAASASQPRIALYEKGYLNWSRPRPGHYGPTGLGMMGMLPHFLATKGIDAERIPELDPSALSGYDALVVVNQVDPFPSETIAAIDDFVRAGGGLLVLGDHTAWRHDQVLINQPLENTAIRFNFDNAEFFVGGWLHSERLWSHPAVSGVDDFENNTGSVIGASLEIDYPAVPLLVGQYGFSDPGDVENSDRGFMSNRTYDPGERLGDLVLAALQDVGEGRLAVVADTTAFSNGVLTTAWPFVSQLFDWLVSDARATPPLYRELLALILLLGFGALWRLGPREGLAEFGVVALLVSTSVTVLYAEVRPWGSPPGTADGSMDPNAFQVALVDHSHLTKASREGIGDDGFSALARSLMRDDFVVLQTREFDPALLDGMRLVVIAAPGRPYSAGEVSALDEYVHAGGELILAVGRDDRDTARSLLERWKFEVTDLPVGRDLLECDPVSSANPATFEGWAVAGAESIARFREHAIILRKPVGAGHVTLIGDGHFFRDKNLETPDGPALDNIQFFRDYIALIRKDS